MNAPQNPPAFPHLTQSKSGGSNTIYTHVSEGMSLRDWFAGKSLTGLLMVNSPTRLEDPRPAIAAAAYLMADAMLAERAKSSS